jgi:hypothetical protein
VGRRVVIGDLRVQELNRRDGRRSWTIVWPEGSVHQEADRFLRRHEGSGTQRTYAYLLVDHLRCGGMIGSLSHLIRGAAIEAILNGSERITKATLETVDLDHATQHRPGAANKRRQPARA